MPRADQFKAKHHPYMTRTEGTREVRPLVLIVCEGKQTEPNYFRALLRSLRLQGDVKGLGDHTLSLVNRTIELKEEAASNGYPYSQVWCVFDRDSFPPGRFNDAISQAEREGLRVAYSNEAFELWYILHFEYLTTGIDRRAYKDKLAEHLGKKYEKNSTEMYEILEQYQDIAIRNAERLLLEYEDHPQPEHHKPSTTVHLLIKALRALSSK